MNSTSPSSPPQAPEPYAPGHDFLDWMGRQFDALGDIFEARLGGARAFVVRDPHSAEHVLRGNWQNYTKGPWGKRMGLLMGTGLIVSDGELWRRQRRMMQPVFHRRVIDSLAAMMARFNNELLATWERAARRHEAVDVTADTSRLALNVVLTAIFGDEVGRVQPQLAALAEHPARDLDFADRFRASAVAIGEIVAGRRTREAAADDMLGMMIAARDADTGQAMPAAQLVDEIKTLIVAGHETTAGTLNWMWYLLSQHPDIADRVAAEAAALSSGRALALDRLHELPQARQVIEETMRLYPVAWLVRRQAIADDRLGGYVLPARAEVYVPIYFIQRNPALWPAPDEFQPDRFAGEEAPARLAMLPFSAGPRNCIGDHFSRTEMLIHLATIAPRLRLAYGGRVPPERDVGINLRTRHNLTMKPELR